MNRIFKYSSLSAIALIAMCSCTDDFLYNSPDSVSNGDSQVPFGSVVFKTGGQTRGEIVTTENLSAVEATAYTDITKNEFKFEKYLFNQKNGDGNLICSKNPQWPGTHRYRKPNDDGSYSEGTTESQKIPEKYSDWKDHPFDQQADTNYANYHEHKEGIVVNKEDVPTGYVYLEDYNDQDWIYIIDYDEPSTLNLFVYSPPLQQLREAFNSGTQGKPGSTGIMLRAPAEVYDFFNTYVDGVGLKPSENYNEHTELKIYYTDGVGKPGYKLGMFHVAQDISRQVDFVTAHIDPKARKINENTAKDENGNVIKDENGNESKYYTLEPVPVHFEHQLCNIEIKARNDNPNYDVDVAGVMLGRPMVYGPMFNFTTNEWEFPPLTRQDLYNIVTYAYSPETNDKHPVGDYIHRLGNDPVSLMGNGGNALVLPTNLEAWDYKDPDNPDAYNFNHGDRPIMFLAALVQVLPKNGNTSSETLSISNMMYPFGKPTKDTWKKEDKDKEWVYYPDKMEGGTWVYAGEEWEYYEGLGWYPYSEYECDGWECDPETGLWSYDENREKDAKYTDYIWLLNWKAGEDGFWTYIGKDTGAEWEMLTDEDGYPYWKYNGKYVFNPETGEWEIPEKIIFPSKYVCDNSNFEYQEFCVDENGDVLEFSYNDRDKSEFTAKQKQEIKSKYKDKDITFKKYAWVGFPVAVDWKKGHKYVYTLDFTSGLGVEIPNGIYGGRLISDIIKLFEEYEKTGKPVHDLDLPNPEIPQKVKSAKHPQGWGSVKVESSVWEPDDIVIK